MNEPKCVACGVEAEDGFAIGRLCYFCIEKVVVKNIKEEKKVIVENQIGVSKEELFTSWVQDLGYDKAVLLSCNYPVLTVVNMSEEDAESEVQAIQN